MRIDIVVAAYNRPEYLQRCLAAIFGMKGIEAIKTPICVAVDKLPDGTYNEAVLAVAKRFECPLILSEAKQGCNGTIKSALVHAWSGNPDFVLLIEDDIIVSPDALMYVQWAAKEYKDDPSVRTIGLWGHNKGYQPWQALSPKEAGKVMRQQYFTCWGWGTWRSRWEEMLQTWTTGDDSHDTSWDVIMSSHLNGRDEILPSIARAYNCGEIGGTHRGRAWPGATSAGLVDPDGPLEFWEYKPAKMDEEWPVYVILGRMGDIYMVARALKQPSIIACLQRFSAIMRLFPQHKVIHIDEEHEHNLPNAETSVRMRHPNKKVITCQQNGQDPKLMAHFRNYQAFQEHYASF
jgi:glycosyltransferase involved in cell wall biosynthesis